MIKNNDIREAARKADVKLWEIAASIGIHESNFSRRLRNELPIDEKRRIKAAISQIKKDRK